MAEEKKTEEKKKPIKARIFEVMQYEKNPQTGEDLHFNESNIEVGLSHKTIKKWQWAKHDKDVHTQAEHDLYKKKYGKAPYWNPGDKKPVHYHVDVQCSAPVTIDTIAKWFGVPANMVEVKKGKNAMTECAEYLTHEDEKQQEIGKHRYDDSEIHASYDWRKEVDLYKERKIKYGTVLNEKEDYRLRVLLEGMTIRDLIDENPIAYQNDYATLDKFRYKYISERAPMPKTRINYYVCGKGGVGKGLICRALARSLYPKLSHDEDIFFEVGAKGAPFEGYDGQPVIIWNDRRAVDLLNELNGRGNVFNVFDTHPTRQKQNVKYSSVCLTNEVNIVNSVEKYEDFLDGLAGEYTDRDGNLHEVEDKDQSYRRFPFIIPLHEKDFDLLMNKGFYEGTREYEQYIEYKNIRGNMQRIAERCNGNARLTRELEDKTVKPIVDKHHEVVEKIEHGSDKTEDEIREEFKDYGKTEEEIQAENGNIFFK